MRSTTWHGSAQESMELLAAIEANCSCEFDALGRRRTCCAGHLMVACSQRALDGLVFARRWLRERVVREEWRGETGAQEHVSPYHFTPAGRSAASVQEFLAICQ